MLVFGGSVTLVLVSGSDVMAQTLELRSCPHPRQSTRDVLVTWVELVVAIGALHKCLPELCASQSSLQHAAGETKDAQMATQ